MSINGVFLRHHINHNPMKKFMKRLSLVCLLMVTACITLSAQTANVPMWERFEKAFTLKTEKNPFTDIDFTATFVHEGDGVTMTVDGFYDGDDTFKIRFMPTLKGKWTYTTRSAEKELNMQEGSLICTDALSTQKGMVQAGKDQNFIYPDGSLYHPVGTTSYAWIHSDNERQEQTYKTLDETGFNKLRFCVFPNNSVYEWPTIYPFKLLKKSHSDELKKDVYLWDFSRFDVKFFQHLDKVVERLRDMKIEADLILFTPYDAGLWGFDRMSMENNMRYLKYVVARLASYSNIWWSMANEWDLVRAKTHDQWIEMSKYVAEKDPYHHLLSIHGGTAVYIDYNQPFYTHASIQDQGPLYNFEGAATVRNIIHKPILFDEVCYEGDHASRWAQLSGEQMLERIWMGLIGGTYVTHGECFVDDMHNDKNYTGYAFLATGGKFRGTCPARIKFTRKILDSLPYSIRLADQSWDDKTACAGPDHYFIYFGSEKPKKWAFNLPAKCSRWPRLTAGKRFKVDIIDTWNMTTTTVKDVFVTKLADNRYRFIDENGKSIKLPGKPYILLHIYSE